MNERFVGHRISVVSYNRLVLVDSLDAWFYSVVLYDVILVREGEKSQLIPLD